MPRAASAGVEWVATGRRRVGLDQLRDLRVGALGKLDLGHVAAVGEDLLPGAGKGLGHMPGEARRHQAVVVAPEEEGGGLEIGEAGPEAPLAVGCVEIDVAQGGVEGDAGGAGAVGLAELLGDDVGGRGVEALRVGRTGPRRSLAPGPCSSDGGSRRARGAAGGPGARARACAGTRRPAPAGLPWPPGRGGRAPPRGRLGRPANSRRGGRGRSPSRRGSRGLTVRTRGRRTVRGPACPTTRTPEGRAHGPCARG